MDPGVDYKKPLLKMFRYSDIFADIYFSMNQIALEKKYTMIASQGIGEDIFAEKFILLDESTPEDLLILFHPKMIYPLPGLEFILSPFKRQDFYGIKSIISDAMKNGVFDQIYNTLRNILITNPHVKNVDISGYSGGCAFGSVFSMGLEYLIAYHRDLTTADVVQFADGFYADSLKNELWKKGPFFDLVKKKLSEKGITNPTDQDYRDAIIAADRELLTKIEIKGVYLIGFTTVFDKSTCEKYNLFESGKNNPKSPYSKTYNLKAHCDPASDLSNTSTIIGKIICLLSGGIVRKAHGQTLEIRYASGCKHSIIDYRDYMFRFFADRARLADHSHTSYFQYFLPITYPISDLMIFGPMLIPYSIFCGFLIFPLIIFLRLFKKFMQNREIFLLWISKKWDYYVRSRK